MRFRLLGLLLLLAASPAFATTWYVRPDGGTRYSANNLVGECNGQGDAAYPGTTTVEWMASHTYAAGTTILDSAGYYETTSSGGTSGTTTPTWGGSTVTDNTITWDKGAAFPVNQPCAFNDVRLLWQDGSFYNGSQPFPAWGWIGAGGDTYLVRGSIGTGASYRIGWPNNGGCIDATHSAAAARGVCGDNINSGMPPPPSGTSSAHTVIEGENFAACSTQTARTQLHGGFGVNTVVGLVGVDYVDLKCLDITDFSACGRASQVDSCSASAPIDDYATNGVRFGNITTNTTLTNIRIHGTAYAGVVGPTGDGVSLSNIDILGNAGSGWNADPGDYTTGIGSLTLTNFSIIGSGCAEEYPVVDSMPYSDCTDDNGGGYGDGFGTSTTQELANGSTSASYSQQLPTAGTLPDTFSLNAGTLPPGLSLSSSGLVTGTPTTNGIYAFYVNRQDSASPSVNYKTAFQIAVGPYPNHWAIDFEQGEVAYNTQDGLDNLHTIGNGATIKMNRVLSYSNMGNQLKAGSDGGITLTNDVIIGNCKAMSTAIPGFPSGFNTHLSDFCRAGNNAVAMALAPGTHGYFAGNTLYQSSYTNPNSAILLTCAAGGCDSTTQITFADNILYGFDSASFGTLPSTYALQSGFTGSPFSNTGSVYSNNLQSGFTSGCPDTGETNTLCAAPQIVAGSTWPAYGYPNVQPSSGTANIVGAGVAVSGLSNDFAGNPRPNPPSIGAYEYVSAPPSGGVVIGGSVVIGGGFLIQ